MTPERWQQVKSTLAGALEQDDTRSRVAFLQEACGDDTELRGEVQSLLDQPPDEFDNVADTIGVANPEPLPVAQAGRRIGAYEVVREIGRGGMGAVWLARRADESFEKLVAVKLLKRGTDTDEVLSRFHAERRILARLDHPNIARLLDAGTTEDHLPYFVMEYVEGARLTDFVCAQNLSLGDRLRLFIKICAAVQFAHQNLVVHRDLKPGNILVRNDGEPKLLDFGVAKLLTPDDSWQNTIAGQERFTPGYASPEQIQGEPITTVSDVYSLGALLYEVLTGVTPHRFPTKTPTATQMARVICEEEPMRPSTAAKMPEVRRQLRGDLDTILLRALAKEPQRRYRSAGQLADDITRYLGNRPVRARPDTFSYRAGKFLRRNKAMTAAAALVLLSLLGGVIATARQAQIANRERARAERRFNEVRKIANSFLFEFQNLIADVPGALRARQLVTQRAVEYLDSLAQEAGDDLSLKAELALAYQQIGALTFDMRQALNTRAKAVKLNEELVAAAPGNSTYLLQLSESYEQYSNLLKINGRSQQAIEQARRALSVAQSALGKKQPDATTRSVLADRHFGVAIALDDAGDFRGAQKELRTAVELREPIAAQNPADSEQRVELMSTYGKLSDACAEAGDLASATAYSEKEMTAAQEMLARESLNARYRRDMWAALFRRGRLLCASGQTEDGLADYHRATQFLEALAAADPQDRGHRRWLAVTYSAIAEALGALQRTAEAIDQERKAIALSEELAQADPDRAEARQDLVKTESELGALLVRQGQLQAALETLQLAEGRAQELIERDPQNARMRSAMAEVYARLAECHRAMADATPLQREAHLRDALAFLKRSAALWDDVERAGMLTAQNRQKPGAVRHAISDCEAALPFR